MKVLLVDDESDLLDQANFFLRQAEKKAELLLDEDEELSIETAGSAEDALEMLSSERYDAIVSDYMMPGMDGIEFLKTLRESNEEIPFIIFTGRGNEEVALEALNLGADHYIRKGGEPSSQYRTLSHAIVQEVKRGRAERARKRSEEKFESLFEHQGVAVFVTKIGGKDRGEILDVNSQALEMTGYNKDELIGMNIIDDLVIESPTSFDYDDLDQMLKAGETVSFTEKKKRKDGSEFWTEVVVSPVSYQGESACISINQDITEQIEFDERKEFLHSLLRHDLKNKIAVVGGYLDLLTEADLSGEYEELLKKALKTNRSCFDFVEKMGLLREVSMEEEVKEVEIKNVIDDSISGHDFVTPSGEIKVENRVGDCKVYGGSLLKELFSNLLENSINHSGCDRIRISSEEKEGKCVVSVEDSGCGISADIRKEIFEKGFRLGERAGSGLGLYLVKEIAESYGGSVDIGDSELGGVRISVSLEKV